VDFTIFEDLQITPSEQKLKYGRTPEKNTRKKVLVDVLASLGNYDRGLQITQAHYGVLGSHLAPSSEYRHNYFESF